MARDRFGLTPRDRLALDAAKLYHGEGLPQEEVAARLHVSRPTVSKLLATARGRGFVRTQVLDPRESDRALIAALRERYHLTDLRLVAPAGRGPADLHHALGAVAAELLRTLTAEDHVVGFWWSDTWASIADVLSEHPLPCRALVQLDGLRPGSAQDASLAAFADRSDVPVHRCPRPVMHAGLAERLAVDTDPELHGLRALQAEAQVLVFGAEGPGASLVPEAAPATGQERESITRSAVGRICGRYLDAEGRIVAPALSQRTLGPTPAALRRAPRTVLVAGGEQQRDVIRAALTNRYARHLVTDVETAAALVDLSD